MEIEPEPEPGSASVRMRESKDVSSAAWWACPKW